MARTYDYDFKTETIRPQAREDSRSRRERIERLDRLATLLDTAILIPGTNIRFGADAIIGLVPGIGDTITTALSAYIVYEAYQLGVPNHVLARMIANVAFDTVTGVVPLRVMCSTCSGAPIAATCGCCASTWSGTGRCDVGAG